MSADVGHASMNVPCTPINRFAVTCEVWCGEQEIIIQIITFNEGGLEWKARPGRRTNSLTDYIRAGIDDGLFASRI